MEEEKKLKIKRSLGEKVINAIFRGDDYKTFGRSLWEDQVLPMMGDILEDVCSRAIHAVFYDDSNYDPRRDRKRRHDYTSHSRRTSSIKRRRDRDRDRRGYSDADDIPGDLGPRDMHLVPFDTLKDAEDCVRYLADLCSENGHAEVRDFYSYRNIASTNFRNRDFGWTDPNEIMRARPKKRDGKYYLDMPRPIDITDLDEEDDYDD